MGIAWKLVVGLVLLLPMTAYVVGSLVAAADEPRQHDPIIVEERSQAPSDAGRPSEKPTVRPSDDENDDHGRGRGRGGDDDEVITPSPSVMDDDDDDDEFDDHGGDNGGGDNSGSGSDNSGKGSGDD